MLLRSVFTLILEVEPDWELEITLDCTALMLSLHAIKDLDVDLWSIEGTTTLVHFPWLSKVVQSLSKGALSLVPKCIASKLLLRRSGGEVKLKGKAKLSIDMIKEVEHSHDFVHQLLGGTEDVTIILLEPAHTSQS